MAASCYHHRSVASPVRPGATIKTSPRFIVKRRKRLDRRLQCNGADSMHRGPGEYDSPTFPCPVSIKTILANAPRELYDMTVRRSSDRLYAGEMTRHSERQRHQVAAVLPSEDPLIALAAKEWYPHIRVIIMTLANR